MDRRRMLRRGWRMVTGAKTGTVWGTLPGMTDETIYVVAHRDGWFDGAGDNASGVATMLGLADYFAKVPRAQRKRTLVLVGTSRHHNRLSLTGAWLLDNREQLFAKTALVINCEHTATLQTYVRGPRIRSANT